MNFYLLIPLIFNFRIPLCKSFFTNQQFVSINKFAARTKKCYLQSSYFKLHDAINEEISEISAPYEVKHNIRLIETENGLLSAVGELSQLNEIALDLEFDRNRYSYGFNLCLIQIYGNSICYIIDPLAFTTASLQKLFEIFEDPKILKVLHSPSEDLRLLNTLHCYPKNLFDTEVCSKIFNFQFTALSTVISTILGINLDKSLQKTNWMQRPLTQKHLEYAASDVLHLIPIKNHFLKLGEEKNLLHWIQEENEAWENIRRIPFDGTHFTTSGDAKIFSPYELHIYNKILILRDKYAKQKNKPGHHILSKDNLLLLAFEEPTGFQYLHKGVLKVHSVLKKAIVIEEFQKTLLQARNEAEALNLDKNKPKKHLPADDPIAILIAKQNKLYEPIQEVLTTRYGQYTSNFLLSKTSIQKIALKEMQFSDFTKYRQDLFQEIAQDLSINLNL